MNTITNINTISHRGIVCIDTFPLELVWAKSNTVLECSNCLTYATFKNVLVGLCRNCAMYSYNGKYGNGFYNYPYSDRFNNEIDVCFGNIHPLNILNIKGVEYPQTALNYKNTYSIYNLSLSSKTDLSLLLQDPYNIYGLYDFQKYYNCDIEVLDIILTKIKEHKTLFNIWNTKYYNKCLDIEKFFKVSEEDYKLQNEITNNNTNTNNNNNTINSPKYMCSYCNTYKFKNELKKCGKCNIPRYCSIACQIRDWNMEHKVNCIYSTSYERENTSEDTSNDESEDTSNDESEDTSEDESEDTSNDESEDTSNDTIETYIDDENDNKYL